jgi:cytosine/adenosine deaminase-related metal-dependent hydrolase
MTNEVILRNGLVDLGAGDFRRRDVLVRGGRICAVGGDIAAPEASAVDCTNYAVVPGAINAHYHSNGNFDRGRWDNLPLEPYGVFAFPRLMAVKLNPREIYVRTLVGAFELLRTGVTCTVDFLYDSGGFTPESMGPVVQAYRDIGLRVVIGLGMSDRPYYETVILDRGRLDPELFAMMDRARPPSWTEWAAIARRAVAMFHRPDEGISIGLAPAAPERCTDELLHGCARLADELDLVIHTHALETRMQTVIARERYGKTLPEHLHALDFLSRRVSFQHGVWLSERDIELVSDSMTTVVHNPVSNMKLGSGVCPVPLLLRRGVNVALGTDAMSCNDSCDMYGTLKVAALLHKLWDVDYEQWLGAHDAWRMATSGGAISAGDPQRLGRIAEGAWADLVLLDLRSRAFTPLNEPINQLVLGAPHDAIDSAMIQGRWVLRNRAITGVGEAAILEEARAIGPEIISRGKETLALADRLVGAVRAGWQTARAQYHGVNRCIDLVGACNIAHEAPMH